MAYGGGRREGQCGAGGREVHAYACGCDGCGGLENQAHNADADGTAARLLDNHVKDEGGEAAGGDGAESRVPSTRCAGDERFDPFEQCLPYHRATERA